MKVSHQRIIDRFIGTLLCRFFSLLPRRFFRRPSSEFKNILVILLSEMGSLTLAYPMFERIAEKFPESEIHILVFERNAQVLDIFDIIRRENILTINDGRLTSMLWGSLRTMRRIRRMRIDAVIDCELFSRVSSLLSLFSGAAIHSGFHSFTQEGLYRGNFINRPVLYNPYVHIAHQFINLIEAVDFSGTPGIKRSVSMSCPQLPMFKSDAIEKNEMRQQLESDFPAIAHDKLILLNPGGGLLPIRAWPLGYFCRLAKDLLNEGFSIGIVGLETDKIAAREIIDFCKTDRSADMTGYTKSLRQLMILFEFSRLLITNDGGPAHFAALTSMPAIVLFGPETPLLYRPLSKNAFCFYTQFSCSPCLTAYNHRNSPCDGNNLCLKSIPPELVLNKALEFLKKYHD